VRRLVGGFANFEQVKPRCVVVDAMLGWLARWLRMLGLDARYNPNVRDEDLVNEVECVVITRDTNVFKSARGFAVLLSNDNHIEWLASVAQAFGIDLEVRWNETRCPRCNVPLLPTDRRSVEDRVPPRVRSERYWVCPSCGQVYWIGRHWKKITCVLEEAKELLKAQGVKS